MNYISIVSSLKESKKLSWCIIIVICLGVTGYSFGAITSHDVYPDYSMVEEPYLKSCDLSKQPHLHYTAIDKNSGSVDVYDENARNPAKWWLDCLGYKMFFGYDNVLPFLFSLGVIILSYHVGFAISKQRLVGILTSLFLSMNPLFYSWNSTVTYGQAWAFFLLFSIYLSYKIPITSPIPYAISVITKGLAFAYLPLYLYTIIKSGTKDWWGIVAITILAVIVFGAVEQSSIGNLIGAKLQFNPSNLGEGVYRAFGIIAWNLPVLFGFIGIEFMFRKYSKPITGKQLSFIWMTGIWLISVGIYIFSGQFSFPYRFVPFAAFMSLYIGIVMTRVIYCFEELGIKRTKLV